MEKLKATREWLYRAIRTFGQAVLGFLASNLAAYLCGVDLDYIKTALLGLAAAAISAGAAAVMNMGNPTAGDGGEGGA